MVGNVEKTFRGGSSSGWMTPPLLEMATAGLMCSSEGGEGVDYMQISLLQPYSLSLLFLVHWTISSLQSALTENPTHHNERDARKTAFSRTRLTRAQKSRRPTVILRLSTTLVCTHRGVTGLNVFNLPYSPVARAAHTHSCRHVWQILTNDAMRVLWQHY